MLDVADVTTDRLRLTAIAADDAQELFAIMSDPAGWWYEPAGQHAELQTTIEFCDSVAAMWLTDGLCYWTARRLSSDELVGLGGARRHRDRTWNLSYRIDPSDGEIRLAYSDRPVTHHPVGDRASERCSFPHEGGLPTQTGGTQSRNGSRAGG